MVKRRDSDAFVRRLVTEFQPDRVLLFGSYARGNPTKDSDVDLLVVMPHRGPPAMKAAELRSAIRAGFPLDLIVRSPAAIRARVDMGDYFIKDILQQGRSLYEAKHAGMD